MSSGVIADLPLVSAPTPHFTRPTFLMCPPEWFDVEYVINPWMAGNLHRPSRDRAFAQWRTLFQALRRFADVRTLPALQHCPDMTYVAHAAAIQHGLAAVSSFAHHERQCEEAPVRRYLQDHGFLLWNTPRETSFEGEGDALFSHGGSLLWLAHGSRTSRESHAHLAAAWHVESRSLHLIDPRFYHLDTCFAPLPDGSVLYYPGAFDPASLRTIEAAFAPEQRIIVSEREATRFACNVLAVGRNLILPTPDAPVASRLEALGYTVTTLDLSEFQRGGGSAKSLALRLSDSTLSA